MSIRLKKFIGTWLLIALVVVYALVATTVAVHRLAEASALAHLTFFLLTGLLWVLPAMWIIKWMATPSKSRGLKP